MTSNIFDDPRDILEGVPFGTVRPPVARPPLLANDGRMHALRRLKLFLSLLDFSRYGGAGKPVNVFRVPIESIKTEQPDDIHKLLFPAISMLGSEGVIEEDDALGPPDMIEESVDVFGRGTVLVYKGTYVERITLELWGSPRAERAALMSGVGEALTSTDNSYQTRLKLPAYFNQIATFEFLGKTYVDDPVLDQRFRRRGHVFVQLRVPDVQLVNYRLMRPRVTSTVNDGGVEALARAVLHERAHHEPDPDPE